MPNHKILEELNQCLTENDNGNDLVLIRNNQNDAIEYSIVNKRRLSILLIDNVELGKELTEVLLKRDVKIFASLREIQETFQIKREKPLFWPDDKPWPPEEFG